MCSEYILEKTVNPTSIHYLGVLLVKDNQGLSRLLVSE